MWFLKDTPALLMDLYELTMAQVYFEKRMEGTACFEVCIRRLPENWGFFVMAGLAELESYLKEFRFGGEDIAFLDSMGVFGGEFLEWLSRLELAVEVRAMPEGTVFFPEEPILEVSGSLPAAQLLESYILNILGFSIIEATLAARVSIAAAGVRVVDFGLRRAQGPVASIRSARAAQMAGFGATSNVFAARALKLPAAGTMAHSFVQAYGDEEQAFRYFARRYGERAILLVDTYDCVEGIKKAARLAKELEEQEGLRIAGIRIDSGDLAELSRFARAHFAEQGVGFLQIFVSGDLDEFKIADLVRAGAPIDGIGIGTRFAVSCGAPAVEIVYKLCEYSGRAVFKSSPGKRTYPGRKAVTRVEAGGVYKKDIVEPSKSGGGGLLRPFEGCEQMAVIRERLAGELSLLADSVKAIRDPGRYPVEFVGFG